MKMRKIVAIMLVLAMSITLLAGCGSNNDNNSSTTTKATTKATDSNSGGDTDTSGDTGNTYEETWKNNTDPVKFTWYVNFSWFTRQWGTDATSKYITEKTGVDIEYIAPAGNEAEKMNTMIASDTLPDIITLGWYEAAVAQMIVGGKVYSLNELADQYDPYFYQVASSEKLGWYQQDDGNTYGYPNASYSPADFDNYKGILVANQTFLVKKDIYEAIGSPDMTTPEGFLNALAMAKEQFPTVNGQPLIPLAFNEFGDDGNTSLEGYLQNLLGIPFEKDGQLYDRVSDPEYLSWLKTFRKANDLGLLAKDIFIDKRAQMEEKIAQGRYFAMIFQSQDMTSQNTQLYMEDPNSCYIAVDGPRNSNGNNPTLSGDGISGWTLTLISKNCKDPDRAIQFLSYLISEEGQHDIKLGAPELWETIDGKDQLKDEYSEIKNTDNDRFEIEYGGENTHWMLMDTAMQQQWTLDFAEPLKQTKDWTKQYVTYTAVYDGIGAFDAMDADTPEEVNRAKISAKWGSLLPKMLLAKSDEEFDSFFQEYLNARDSNDYNTIMNIRNEKLTINKQKLGMN